MRIVLLEYVFGKINEQNKHKNDFSLALIAVASFTKKIPLRRDFFVKIERKAGIRFPDKSQAIALR